MSIHFIELEVTIKLLTLQICFTHGSLLLEVRWLSEFYIFQQDGAVAHRARETVALLTNETHDFINPTLWLPNSPDLNPDDYKMGLHAGNGVQNKGP